MELIIVTEPALAASAGVNQRFIRSAPSTLTSKAELIASRSTTDRSLIGGIASALCTSASARPNSARVASLSRSAAAGSEMSVGTARARRPSAVTSLATSSRRDSVRASRTTSAPCSALLIAIDRPSPGPIPETMTTLSCSSIWCSPLQLIRLSKCQPGSPFSAQHPPGDRGLTRRDPLCVLAVRAPRLMVERQAPLNLGDVDDFGLRSVLGQQVTGKALPPKLDIASAVPRALKPVSDAWVTLADDEPEPAVRIRPGLIRGEAGLVVDVVERDIPAAAELDPLIGGDVPAGGRHGHDHGLVVVQVIVPDRGELGGQPARRRPWL